MKTINTLYQMFDQLVEHGSDDELFASSYIRGFLTLAEGDSPLTSELFQAVTAQLGSAKTELSPQDQVIVNHYWLSLEEYFQP